jgi:hypothetical protein
VLVVVVQAGCEGERAREREREREGCMLASYSVVYTRRDEMRMRIRNE